MAVMIVLQYGSCFVGTISFWGGKTQMMASYYLSLQSVFLNVFQKMSITLDFSLNCILISFCPFWPILIHKMDFLFLPWAGW